MTKLDEAIAGFPIVAWAEEHLGEVRDRGTDTVHADCPFCGGKRKLVIWTSKRLFHCFKCSDGGYATDTWNGKANLFQMIVLVEKCTKFEAIKKIFSMAGLPDPPRKEAEVPKIMIPEESIPLTEADPNNPAIVYLTSRNVKHLVPYSTVSYRGQYTGRVIIQTNYFGEPTGFEAKSYSNQQPKSLFPDWMDTYSTFYTTPNWQKHNEFAIITESVIDAETFGMNAIGLYGSTVKDGQWQRLLECRPFIKRLYWLLDGDAWRKQMKAIITRAFPFFENRICNIPKDQDPNSLGVDKCIELIEHGTPVFDEFDLVRKSLEFGHYL